MSASNDYKLLDQAGTVIAMGTQSQMFSFIKHHVSDGRYRIVGDDIKLYCLRKDGNVEPDPDGVCLEAKSKVISVDDLLDMMAADPPQADEEGGDGDE